MKLLERHFEIALETPDGITKLRELILSLAMKGKLVVQNSSDQPASELLKEIEAKKKNLIKEGKIKKQEPLPLIKNEEIPYVLPHGWEWSNLFSLGEINPRNEADDELNVAFIPMPLIFAEYGKKHSYEERKWGEIKKGFTHFAENDVVLAKITPCFENGKSCVMKELPNGIGAGTTELHVFRNSYGKMCPEYILAFFKSARFISNGIPRMTGSAGQKRVPRDYFSYTPFPLPPFAEQKRIVAKIDQLMALCDKLEAERNERDKKRLAIHTAAMNRLLTAADKTSNIAYSFISKNFNSLYSVPENVEDLKKAILQLAVMGKLVPQDPNDQPASELLKEIEAGKEQLVKDGKIKVQKPLPPIKPEEVPYLLPGGWEWCRLGDVGIIGSSSRVHQRDWTNKGIPFYRAREIVKLSKFGTVENDLFITEDLFYTLSKSGTIPEPGDLMITGVGTIGIPYVVKLADKFYFKDASVLIFQNHFKLFPQFMYHFLKSPYWIDKIHSKSMGTTVHTLTIIRANEIPFPCPPLAEQKRIVAKIDQLMELCNSLGQQIKDSTTKQTAILDAVLARL